jgi:uncharacterized protein (DUF58 family)
VAITLAVGAAAMNTGNNLLYLALSMNLSLVVLSGFLSEGSLRGVRGVVAPASEFFAGREGLVSVRLDASGKTRASRSLSVLLRTGEGEVIPVPFPDLPPGGMKTRAAPFVPSRRGPCRLAPCALVTTYPFGLFEKSLDLPAPAPFLVYPAPFGAPDRDPGEPLGGGEGRATRRGADGTGLAGVREHLPGDARREMHWKASARLGRWMVKERERERERPIAIPVRVPTSAGLLEGELSRACGAVLAALRAGRPFLLSAGAHSVADDGGGGGRREALALLARLRADGTVAETEAP